MDIIFKKIVEFKYKINNKTNLNILKFIIKNINQEFIIYTKKYKIKDFNPQYPKIYFNLGKNTLLIFFSHMYFDGYSIFYILNLIDNLYIDLCNENINENNFTNSVKFIEMTKKFELILEDINKKKLNFSYSSLIFSLIKNNSCKDFYNFISNYYKILLYFLNLKKLPSNYKYLYVDKQKIIKNNKLSTLLLFEHLQKKLKFNNYNIVVNARKIFNNYDNKIYNYIYVTKSIKNNEDLKKILNNDSKKNFNDLEYQLFNENICINSYLSFKLPSFIENQILDNLYFENVFIFPTKDNDKYIKVLYRI